MMNAFRECDSRVADGRCIEINFDTAKIIFDFFMQGVWICASNLTVEQDGPAPKNEFETRYSGIRPQKGWPARNLKFLRHRIVPGIFRRTAGDVLEPILAPPELGKVRITWIGHASFYLQFAGHSVIVDPNWAKWHGPVKRQRRPGLDLDSFPEVD
jgi:hypothetical protein